MRTVYRISQEGAIEREDQRQKLLESRPELAELAECAAADATSMECRIKLAEAYFREGLLFGAYTLFNEVLKLNGEDFRSTLGVARIWDKWGDYSMARRFAGGAIAIDPLSAIAHEVMGTIHLHRNAPAEALAEFTKSLELASENPVATANLGYAQMLLQNWPEAKAWFEKALSLDSTLVETRNNLGIVLAQMGDYKGALEQLQLVSGPAVAYNNLGVILLIFRKQPAAAVEAFEQALRYAPDYEKARANLAAARAQLPRRVVVNLPPSRPKAEPFETVESKLPEPPSAVDVAARAVDIAEPVVTPVVRPVQHLELTKKVDRVNVTLQPTENLRRLVAPVPAPAVSQASIRTYAGLAFIGLIIMTFLTSRRLLSSNLRF